MVHGLFVQNIPLVPVTIAWQRSIQTVDFILDTGFTGDLQVTTKMAEELGLKVVGVTPTQNATGQTVNTPNALALASMEGVTVSVQVLISNSFPLAGICFLTKYGYKAIVDCKFRTVVLQK